MKPRFHSYSVALNYLGTSWHHMPLKAASGILSVLSSMSVRHRGGNPAFCKAAHAPWWLWTEQPGYAQREEEILDKVVMSGTRVPEMGSSAWEEKT